MLSGLCSEIVAHMVTSEAIVSLVCLGTGGGSKEKGEADFKLHCRLALWHVELRPFLKWLQELPW